jgi:hypothetical protein
MLRAPMKKHFPFIAIGKEITFRITSSLSCSFALDLYARRMRTCYRTKHPIYSTCSKRVYIISSHTSNWKRLKFGGPILCLSTISACAQRACLFSFLRKWGV